MLRVCRTSKGCLGKQVPSYLDFQGGRLPTLLLDLL